MTELFITNENVTPCGECCDGCGHKLGGTCAGCRNTHGRECAMWENGCAIYACAEKHNVYHCGFCNEFPCRWLVETTGKWGSPGLPVLKRLREETYPADRSHT